jgi:DNA polymerase-3 subunit epsilon
VLVNIPESPGVYLFYGLNALPLYVGKSINLRERVAAHFSSDYRSANDLRLSTEIQRIEFETTAGELGALLRESQLIKALLPAHNHRLRRRQAMVAIGLTASATPAYVPSSAIDSAALDGFYGPYNSRGAARAMLRALAAESRLCWTALGLERRIGPCFARQVRRCAGACVGEEPLEMHAQRLRNALAAHALKRWPYPGMIAVRERDITGERSDLHLFRDWCWLGTARDEGALSALIESAPRTPFDLDIYRLLVKSLPRAEVHIIADGVPA